MADWWEGFADRETLKALRFFPLWDEWVPQTAMGQRLKRKLRPFLPGEKDRWLEEVEAVHAFMSLAREKERILPLLHKVEDLSSMIEAWGNGMIPQRADWHSLYHFLLTAKEILESPGWEAGLRFFPKDALRRMKEALCILTPARAGAEGTNGFSLEALFPRLFQPLQEGLQRLERDRLRFLQQRKKKLERELGFSLGNGAEVYLSRSNFGRIEALERHPAFVRVRETPFEVVFAMVEAEEERAFAGQRAVLECAWQSAEEEANRQLDRKLSPFREEILEFLAGIGRLDYIYAKACFAAAYQGTMPVWDEQEEKIDLRGGIHPWLKRQWAGQGREFTLVDLCVTAKRVSAIVGPNMGGKSVSIKTFGTCLLLAQLAFPVPAESFHFRPVEGITFIGGEQEKVEAGLSSFGGEVERIARLWEHSRHKKLLILCDEVGRGTNPEEGEALATALVEELAETGWYSCFVSHYGGVLRVPGLRIYQIRGLKEDLRENRGPFDWTAQMDYRLQPVEEGHIPHTALTIAKYLGLPARILARAEELLSKGKEGK